MIMKAADWAKGHWPEIIAALIGGQYIDGKHHPCPSGKGKDCFRFSNINKRGNYFCRCSSGGKDGFDLIMCQFGVNFPGAVQLVESIIGERPNQAPQPRVETYAERLRRETEKTPRSRYLEGRGLILPEALDWHPRVKYWEDGHVVGTFKAMLAPVTRSGRFLTYHTTYLHQNQKAPVLNPKKILPSAVSIKGAAVELFPAEPTLGVAEGIETAIAAHLLFGVPVWSVLNTSLMKSWRPPAGVERVMIFGDHDENYAGQAAAYALAREIQGKVDVELHFPQYPGDWNDVLIRTLAVNARDEEGQAAVDTTV